MLARFASLAVAGLTLAMPLQAQTPRPMLDYDTAATIRDTCIAWAEERELTIAVAVYDEAGRLITFAFMDGTATAVTDFAMWKGRSAATVHVASKETANWGQGAPGVATWEGGVPFFTGDGVALGGVGVSGADSADDTACGEAGIAAAGLRPAAD
ncbi:GlcG/HbpS family heme-binding protein [Alteraurantiacibacter aquimixticola]|uniref:Heme-binding protein n=1 Tax=Alteraurantiacibacter aquimixticola TaxID=2489173 RepID=A0A4T3F2V0_9SPHN|nr:heme-binding protein [Alteraurantiacibacter aquimixticola]TIX51468.1 heme-binding protein [Alteraurantiacibacter aquimixticola]